MNVLSALLLVFAGGALQAVLPAPALAGQTPIPILAALVVHHALIRSRAFALGVAIIAGVMCDSLGRIPLGVSSAAFAVVALFIGRYQQEVFESWVTTHAALGALAVPLATLITTVLLAAMRELTVGVLQVLVKLAGAAVLGAFVTPAVAVVATRFERLIGTIPEVRR